MANTHPLTPANNNTVPLWRNGLAVFGGVAALVVVIGSAVWISHNVHIGSTPTQSAPPPVPATPQYQVAGGLNGVPIIPVQGTSQFPTPPLPIPPPTATEVEIVRRIAEAVAAARTTIMNETRQALADMQTQITTLEAQVKDRDSKITALTTSQGVSAEDVKKRIDAEVARVLALAKTDRDNAIAELRAEHDKNLEAVNAQKKQEVSDAVVAANIKTSGEYREQIAAVKKERDEAFKKLAEAAKAPDMTRFNKLVETCGDADGTKDNLKTAAANYFNAMTQEQFDKAVNKCQDRTAKHPAVSTPAAADPRCQNRPGMRWVNETIGCLRR